MSDSDRSIPPLDQHLKTITENGRVERTRLDKVLDHILGHIVTQFEEYNRSIPMLSAELLIGLALTKDSPHLPNRIRLLELVEAAMPKETK